MSIFFISRKGSDWASYLHLKLGVPKLSFPIQQNALFALMKHKTISRLFFLNILWNRRVLHKHNQRILLNRNRKSINVGNLKLQKNVKSHGAVSRPIPWSNEYFFLGNGQTGQAVFTWNSAFLDGSWQLQSAWELFSYSGFVWLFQAMLLSKGSRLPLPPLT